MISPPGWKLKRPGIFIPVFFLSLIHGMLTSQIPWQDAASAALGGARVCTQGYMCASQNQAGLGFIEHSSLSIQHGWPYLLKELGISSLSGQFRSGKGAAGLALSTMGLKGFRQSSLWLSYGLRLHPDLSAGIGIHLWNSSIAEQIIYAPGISFALGLQVEIHEHWMLGARLIHPYAWTSRTHQSKDQDASIELGFSYSFFRVAFLYSELHIKAGAPLQVCGGAEWLLKGQSRLRTGICSQPFSFSWGISLGFTRWILDFTFRYWTDSGLSPQSALSYVW